jgi:uncharacterized membrane protein YdjX (TVP38/TMEM64 family)
MRNVTTILRENLPSLLFLTIIFGSLYLAESLTFDVKSIVGENRAVSALVLTGLMYGATVLAPITVLPMVPVISPVLGPFLTGVACWVGWTLGAITAFWIARHGGRPLMRRFADMEKLARYESRIPKEAHFFVILALRLIFPVDVLSYALGVFSTVHGGVHALASAIGILWFSFAFSYIGYAFDSENAVLFIAYGVASLIIFLGALWYVYRVLKKNRD